MKRLSPVVAAGLFAALGAAGCSDPLVVEISPPPAPAIEAIYPDHLSVGDPSAWVLVYGTRFSPSSVIRWDGRELPSEVGQHDPLYPGLDILFARVPLSDLDETKDVAITVFSPSQAHPPGVASNPWPYRVLYPRARPCEFAPLFAAVGSTSAELRCRGWGYMPETEVYIDLDPVDVERVDFHTLRFTVPAALLAEPTTLGVRTLNPGHEGLGWTTGSSLHVIRPVVVGGGGKQMGKGCIIDATGVLQCWDSAPRPVTEPLRFLELAATGFSSCARATNGSAYCWGTNHYGELGIGVISESPWSVTTEPEIPVAGDHDLRGLAVGGGHACGLDPDGAGWCWGSNASDQLGTREELEECQGSLRCASRPVPVAGGLRFTSIAAGGSHTCGLDAGGVVWCWGSDEGGQLGNGPGRSDAEVPHPVDSELRFASVTARGSTSCAITAEGAAFCWGGGRWTEPPVAEVPTPVLEGRRIQQLALGPESTGELCGITLDGDIFCGRRGTVQPMGLGHRWTEIRLGEFPMSQHRYFMICGFTTAGRFLCWGEHDYPWGTQLVEFPLTREPDACERDGRGYVRKLCYPTPTPVFGVAGQEWP